MAQYERHVASRPTSSQGTSREDLVATQSSQSRANFTHTPRDLKELDRDVDAEKENQKGDDLATRMGTRMGTAKPQKNGDLIVPYVMTWWGYW